MDDIQLRALDGLVELWSDTFCGEVYRIEDKRLSAYQLKPFVKAALAEPGSRVHKYISKYMADRPRMVKAWAIYGQLPAEARQAEMNLRRGKLKDRLYLFNITFYNFAVIYIITGISAVEAERRLKEHFASVLSSMSLDELMSELNVSKRLDEISVHTWLSLAPLFPGSIAGADKRLESVLKLHLKTVSGDTNIGIEVTHYEEDLKAALWECFSGSKYWYKAVEKMLVKQGFDTEKITAEQMATAARRIFEGQEIQLLRAMLLRVLRQTIADLPDIRQDLRKLETQGREIPLTEEVLATVPSRRDDLVEPSPADLLEHIGISRDNTSEAEWQVFMMLSQKVLDGELEVGSKTGLSISATLGKDASRVRKTISRYRRERQLNR